MLSVPDVNQVLKKLNGRFGLTGILKFLYYKRKIDAVRMLIGGVKKEYRQKGVMAALYSETEKNAMKLGYKRCEFGWTLEDNDTINSTVLAAGGRIYKKYRICEKDI